MPACARARGRPLVAAAACLGLIGGVLADAGPGRAQQQAGPAVTAVLQGLDKTTARVSTIEVPVDGTARFGTLEITARACYKKPPTETPESAAFLEIVDVRPDSPAVRVFTGWMFASSPALSAMEHPVYDVWVVDCRKAGPGDQEEATAPPGGRSAAPGGDESAAPAGGEPDSAGDEAPAPDDPETAAAPGSQ